MTENKEDLEKSISDLKTTHLNIMSSRIEECQHFLQDTRNHILELQRNATSYNDAAAAKSDDTLNLLEGHLDRLHNEIRNLHLHIETDNERNLKAGRDESRKIKEAVDLVRKEQEESSQQISFGFQYILAQIRTTTLAADKSLKRFLSFSEEILRYLRENARANLEFRALLCKIQASIPQRIFTSSQDSIHFIDALGRTKYLPYEFFRHFKMFEAMLRSDFEGLPGERKVSQSQYIIITSTSTNYSPIDRVNWQQRVFPETKIKMSVVMERLVATSGFCPRPNCDGKIGRF